MLTLKDREEIACKTIDDYAGKLKELASYIHDNPELGQQEFKAVEAISCLYQKEGWLVKTAIGKAPELKTSLWAGKTSLPMNNQLFHMAFLGEYDALPCLGHGCGHNLIATMSVGASFGFDAAAHDIATSTFLGCPAEETIGGKVFMAEEGLFKPYDAALIIHPGGGNEIGGTSLATHPLEITFHGRSAHVASLTDSGINALMAASEVFLAVMQLKAEFPKDKRVIIGGIYTEAGTAPNVIPDRAVLHFTVRAGKVDYLETIVLPAVRAKAEEIARKYGAGVEIRHYEPLFKDMQQNSQLLTIVEKVMGEFGEAPKHILDDEADGSTDVGNVTYEIPTVHPTINIGLGLEAHTPEFATAAGSDFAKEQAVKGAKIMAVSALRYLYEVKRLG